MNKLIRLVVFSVFMATTTLYPLQGHAFLGLFDEEETGPIPDIAWKKAPDGWEPALCDNPESNPNLDNDSNLKTYKGPQICDHGSWEGDDLENKDCSKWKVGLVVKTYPEFGSNYICTDTKAGNTPATATKEKPGKSTAANVKRVPEKKLIAKPDPFRQNTIQKSNQAKPSESKIPKKMTTPVLSKKPKTPIELGVEIVIQKKAECTSVRDLFPRDKFGKLRGVINEGIQVTITKPEVRKHPKNKFNQIYVSGENHHGKKQISDGFVEADRVRCDIGNGWQKLEDIGMPYLPKNPTSSVSSAQASSPNLSKTRFGVAIQAITNELANFIGLGSTEGALVQKVKPGSPAALGGIQKGDVIVKFGSQDIKKFLDLPPLVKQAQVGQKIPVQIIRGSKVQNLSVIIGGIKQKVKTATPKITIPKTAKPKPAQPKPAQPKPAPPKATILD
jgi:hypothetical protein